MSEILRNADESEKEDILDQYIDYQVLETLYGQMADILLTLET
jgi:hypothetical protein